MIWAHPRSRGENSTGEYFGATSLGSSPLTRGKPIMAPEPAKVTGLIPAHAGKTGRLPRGRPRRWAHPRSRGENIVDKPNVLAGLGSSPLTRGKPWPARRGHRGRGLIPAHAGKTQVHAVRTQITKAHPRSRGENVSAMTRPAPPMGSSPLTRGKPAACRDALADFGLIPAHAGKTQLGGSLVSPFGAHPRSRGENVTISLNLHMRPGSSPLTRGKPCVGQTPHPLPGLIPAHAGKTRVRFAVELAQWAHPRSRGENATSLTLIHCLPGSSPLTRGKHYRVDSGKHAGRLIPAHAGKTCRCARSAALRAAHPRSRGENSQSGSSLSASAGSSPLTRGKRQW